MSLRSKLCSLVLTVLLTQFALAQMEATDSAREVQHEAIQTANFREVKTKVMELVEKYGAQEVLLVVDIDNTLLAMNQDLGSDQWFNWQSNLLQFAPNSEDLVAKSFDGLLEAQGTLFSLSQMHAPEPDLPKHLRQIQDNDVPTVVLTSRGPNFRDAAERELARNNYDLSRTQLLIQENRGLFSPQLSEDHPMADEINSKINSKLRDVSYSNGIYMTAGQHKGYMLKTLLARNLVPQSGNQNLETADSKTFRAIVFVDDHEKHTARMHDAFQDNPIDLFTFHYTRESGNVKNFEDSSKRHVIQGWNRLQESMDEVLIK